jgi:hypothetical protein
MGLVATNAGCCPGNYIWTLPAGEWWWYFCGTCTTYSYETYCCGPNGNECSQQCGYCDVTQTPVCNGPTVFLPEIPCQLNAIAERTHPSTNTCTDGAFTVSGFTNACNGYYVTLYSDDGNYINSIHSANNEDVTFSNLMQGNYDIVVTSSPEGCSVILDDLLLYTPECVSPLAITTTPASGYGCPDGTLIIEETDQNCDWQLYTYRLVDNYNFWNPWTGNYGINQNGNQEMVYGGLYPGTYAINSIRTVYDYDGNYLECSVWDTVVVEPGTCTLDGSIVSITPNLNSSCNGGVIEMIATSNTCDGYHIEIKTALGNHVHTAYYIPSGQTTSFNYLLPGDYVVRFFTTDWFGIPSSVCEEFIPFTVEDLGCLSPLHITTTPASGYGCPDGTLIIEDTDQNCDWQLYTYRVVDNYNFWNPWTGNYAINQNGNQEMVYGGLYPGTYAINSVRTVNDYDGNLLECSVWDTVVVEPGTCTLDGSIVSITPNLNSSCNGGVIEMMATSNTCDGYHIEIKTTLGNAVHATYNIPSGQTTTFNNLLPGEYYVRFFTTDWFGVSSSICEEFIPFTVENLGCVSPLQITTTTASAYGCADGAILVEETDLNCDWSIGYVRAIDNYLYGNVWSNWYGVDENGFNEIPFYNLYPGTYYINSTRSLNDYDGNLLECFVSDTVVVEPGICTLDGSIVNITPNLNASCNGSVIEMLATSNTCDGYHIEIKTTLGNTVHAAYNISSGQTTNFNNLLPGEYYVRFFTSDWFGVSSSICEEFIPFTIEDTGCVSPLIISTAPSNDFCSSNGSLIIEEINAYCDFSIYVYRLSDNALYLNYNSYYSPLYEQFWMPAGDYSINAYHNYYDYNGNLVECSTWDYFTIGSISALDADGDGFHGCQGDCDDNNPNIYPGAPDLGDGCIDYNCDGYVSTTNGNLLFVSDHTWTNSVSPSPYDCGSPFENIVNGFVTYSVWGNSLPATTISKTFNYTPQPGVNVLMHGAVDDDLSVFVNGQLVYSYYDSYAGYFPIINLSPFLNDGSNLLEVELYDAGGCATFYAAVYEQDLGSTWFYDGDNDGFGDPQSFIVSCSQPNGYVLTSNDCDDSDNTVYPGAPPTGEGHDNNCDGTISSEEEISCPADFNNDNVVNTTDLLLFISSYGCSGTCAIGDLNDDGFVNTTDLLLFISAYGSVCN